MTNDILDRDAIGQAEAIRSGDITPAELLDASLERIDAINPTVNAVVTDLREEAAKQAQSPAAGPFQGVPLLLKALACSVPGHPISQANRVMKKMNWRAKVESHLCRQFLDAGFVFTGRTNTPEFGLVGTTESVAHGPCANPWDTTRTASGSSGGAAAAVATRMVAAGHGSDAGGSIRGPASACGVVGLKASRGRISSGPGRSDARAGFTIEGVLTRTVRDTAAILDAISHPMPGDAYVAPQPASPFAEAAAKPPRALRIGLTTRAPDSDLAVDAECAVAATNVAKLLEELGHQVTESAPEAYSDEDFRRAYGVMYLTRAARTVAYWSEQIGQELGPDDVEQQTWACVEYGRNVSGTDYLTALERVQKGTYAMAGWWENDADILITPTLTEPPPRLGDMVSTDAEPLRSMTRSTAVNAFLWISNATGQPAISLPLHWTSDGLPIGVQLIAAHGREDLLLSLATQLEAAQPWADRVPPMIAQAR